MRILLRATCLWLGCLGLTEGLFPTPGAVLSTPTVSTPYVVDPACGPHKPVRVTDRSGTVSSPLYPLAYPPNLHCQWQIHAPDRMIIKLDFPVFDLEGWNQDKECGYDNVTILQEDRNSEKGELLGTFCGKTAPKPIVSERTVINIVFKTDQSNSYQGFKIYFEATTIEHFACKRSGPPVSLKLKQGEFVTPGYWNPGHYPPNQICRWTAQATLDEVYMLSFWDIDMLTSNFCSKDNLSIYNGNSTLKPLLRKICGTAKEDPVTTGSNAFFAVFTSTDLAYGRGVRMAYQLINRTERACGSTRPFVSYEAPGYIVSPNFGHGDHPPNIVCHWAFEAPLTKVVKLTFVDFDLESSRGCMYDYVAVYDGDDYKDEKKNPLLGKFCGSIPPQSVFSTEKHMYVVFRTDSVGNARGFLIDYIFTDPPRKPVLSRILGAVVACVVCVLMLTGMVICYKRITRGNGENSNLRNRIRTWRRSRASDEFPPDYPPPPPPDGVFNPNGPEGIMLTPPDYSTLEGPPPSYEETMKPKEETRLGEEVPAVICVSTGDTRTTAPSSDQNSPTVVEIDANGPKNGEVDQSPGTSVNNEHNDVTLPVTELDSVGDKVTDSVPTNPNRRDTSGDQTDSPVQTHVSLRGTEGPHADSSETLTAGHVTATRHPYELPSHPNFPDRNVRQLPRTYDRRFRSLQDLRYLDEGEIVHQNENSARPPSWHRSMQSLDVLQRAHGDQRRPVWALKEMSDTEV